jgi:hypothetical protein
MSDPDPTRDPFIAQHEEAAMETGRAARAANLFDLRRMIGGIFLIYGVILVILGIGADQEELDKAAGWNLNLSVGIAMLVVAALFLIWAFTRPLARELGVEEPPEGDRTVPGAHPPSGPDAAALPGSETTRRRPGRDLGRPGE